LFLLTKMPIEDVDYLKQNSEKQSYIFLINSKDRNKAAYPTPSEYVIDFSQPFHNVIGLNVVDASIPRTMYNVDQYNNTFHYFIHASNYDLSGVTADHFAKATIDPGDYTVQTLVDTLNRQLVMPLNSNLQNSNVSIHVTTLTNPPDIKNRIKFDCPYPFLFDMNRSTIAESLGFDMHVQTSELSKPDLEKNYIPYFSTGGAGSGLQDNYQLYRSVDLPYSVAQGTNYTLYEGPRGVIRKISLNNLVAQRFYLPTDTTVTQVFAALQASDVTISPVDFNFQADVAGVPSGISLMASDSSIAISYVDGTLSDSAIQSLRLSGSQYYWIVFKNNYPLASIYYNDVLATATTMLKYNGAVWESVDDLTNQIYYQLSIRIEVTDDYHRISAPGIYSLIGEPYLVIRCKEIEENSFRSLAYTNHQLGIAKIKLGIVGYREERLDFSSIPNREFHPIGRLSRLTLRFETGNGLLYDFKGVNHNITFGVKYYEPVMKAQFERSLINKNYTGDFMSYMYSQAEQEEESDDEEEDLNRDTLENYRVAEARNLPWQLAQRNIQNFYDLNLEEEEDAA